MSKSVREIDKGFKALKQALKRNPEMRVKVGYFEEVHKAESGEPSGVTMATLARVHELGFKPKNIPPRPWMRPAVQKQREYLAGERKRLAIEAMEGRRTMQSAVFEFGEFARTEITKSLMNVTSPKRKHETRRTRGKHLLIITGALRNSAQTRVIVGGHEVQRSRSKAKAA